MRLALSNFPEQGKVIHGYFRKVLFFNQLLGIFPYSFTDEKFRPSYKWLLTAILTSVFCFVTTLMFALAPNALPIKNQKDVSARLGKWVYTLSLVSLPFFAVFNMLLTFRRYPYLNTLIQLIKNADLTLTNLGLFPKDGASAEQIVFDGFYMAINLVTVSSYFVSWCFGYTTHVDLILATYYVVISLCLWCTVWQFSEFCYILSVRYFLISSHLRQISRSGYPDRRVPAMEALTRIHSEISEGCSYLELIYDRQLFTTLSVVFFQSISNMFFLVRFIENPVHSLTDKCHYAFKRVSWLMAFTMVTVKIVRSCNLVRKKVSFTFKTY